MGEIPPEEPHATCADCAMCGPGAVSFAPSLKCCTFTPTVPNFLLGTLLRDRDPAGDEGRRRLRAALAAGRVSPLGVAPTEAERLVYRNAEPAFGRSPDLACPWLGEAGCTLWASRNAVCATWFCKHERGGTGQAAWHALRRLLTEAEEALARACVLALDPGPAALALLAPPPRTNPDLALDAAALAGRVDPAAWGTWAGREEAFLVACAEHADGLDPEAVAAEGGSRLAVLRSLARVAWGQLHDPALPPVLVPATVTLGPGPGPGLQRLAAYSELDPLDVPAALVAALGAFDGRPLDAVLGDLDEAGTPVSLDLVRLLVDFGVLVPG